MRLRTKTCLSILPLVPLFLVSCGGGDGGDEATARRVILITCDTLRADRLGLYGYEHDTSPELDAFAREAVVFDHAYATAPVTIPSVCSMLTGRLPAEIGVEHNRQYLRARAKTLAEELSFQEIRTAAVVSNWVLKRVPGISASSGVHQGFVDFDDQLLDREIVRGMPERVAPRTTEAAQAWLTRQLESGEDRFFLWVHYQDPHGPYTPPSGFVSAVDRPLSDEPSVPFAPGNVGSQGIPQYQRLGDERNPEHYRVRYDAEIRYFDDALGRLFAFLKKRDLLDDSLIIISSDHGESLGEHGYWFCHGESLNHELVHVPFVIRYPDGMSHPATRREGDYDRVSAVVSLLDVWPTVLEAFGLESGPCPGTSLLAPRIDEDRIAVQMLEFEEETKKHRAINTLRYRLQFVEGGESRLYDLVEDPATTNDIAAERPEVVTRLQGRYAELLKRSGEEWIEGRIREMGPEELEILRNLGYGGGGDTGE